MLKSIIQSLLKRYSHKPIKHMGQNFLINQKILWQIIQTADLSENDIVLEIGPGLGILTKELAKRAEKVIAVEKDEKMVEILREIIGDAKDDRSIKNIKIIREDILKVKIPDLISGKYKLVANIPYYLTSPLIRMFLESENPPQEIILLVQKEVAQRICAQPPKMSLLAIAVQFYAKPKIVSYVSRKSFWPQPKIDSAIIKISPTKPQTIREFSRKYFFKIVKTGFSSPRKQLINNLSHRLKIEKEQIKKVLVDCGLNEKARPGDLLAEDWIKLVKRIKSNLDQDDDN